MTKERIGKELLEYARWYKDSCVSRDNKLAMSIELKNRVEKIVKIFEQANPIQAGEDGLLADEEIQELYDSDDYGDGFALWKEIAIRQKALTESQAKQKQAEAVKKIFDWLEDAPLEDGFIVIDPVCLEEFKQTLGGK
jgi:hypothetical protein